MAADQFDVLSQKARQALAEGKGAQARQFYLQALAERPDAPDAHYGLATAAFLLGDLETAAFHFKEVTRLDPLRAGAHINLGAVFNRLNQLDDAVKSLQRGIQLDSRRAEAYYNLGVAYRRKNQAELAIQAYREATRLNPRMADAHYNLGNLLYEIGRFSQAIQHYKQALDVHPQFDKARLGMQQAELALNQETGETPHESDPTPAPARSPVINVERMIDPVLDGAALTVLHKATIVSENYTRELAKILEQQVETTIKDLSSCLLYPEKTGGELSDKLHKFEAALSALQSMQRNVQVSLKKVRELNNKLLEPVHQVN